MARPRSVDQQEEQHHTGGNGLDPSLVKGFVGRIERVHDELASEKGSYMERCKSLRMELKGVYDDAKVEGLPKKELKAVVLQRELDRKREACREDLEGDERDTFDQILAALGPFADTPLGGAALAQAQH